MYEEELKTEIERIKKRIKNTDSFFRKRDMRKYLKNLRKDLKEVQRNEDKGS